MRIKSSRSFVVLLFLVLTFTACANATPEVPTEVPVSGRITFAGSTTVQPLAAEIARAFNAAYPDVILDIAAGGSSVGIKAVHDGTVDVGMASRRLTSEEAEGIEVYQIAVDVIAMVVNAENPVDNLTSEQLRAIYSGEINHWSEVGGNDAPILVAVRETTSGTRKAFDELVLDEEEPKAPNMERLMTAGDVAAYVVENPDAIGYVGFGNFESGLKPISIDSVEPNEANARDGSYQLTRPLQLLAGPLTQPLAHTFIEFALSKDGQQVVVDSGWIPAN